MAGPFETLFNGPEAQPGVTPAADTFINRIFGPPIPEQGRMAAEATAYRQNSAFHEAQQRIAKLAQEGRSPSEIAQGLLMDPSSGILKDLSADQMKQVFSEVIPSMKPMPKALTAGNSIFLHDQDKGSLSLGAEGGHSETERNFSGDIVGESYRPGQTFGGPNQPAPGAAPMTQPSNPGASIPSGLQGTNFVYPSVTGGESQHPNNAWWIANASAPPELQQLFAVVGQKYGLPPDMLASQSYKESRWNPNATSPKGAQGISQFMPDTAAEWNVTPADVASSIDGQGRYMKHLLDKYQGNYRHALMAYNWGMGNVDKWVRNGSDPAEVPTETTDYVRTITGDTGPLPKIEYRPGMNFEKALQAYLPDNGPAKVSDVDKVAMANPALMFLGAGAIPIIAEVGQSIGRQISPEVESEWGIANNYARSKLRQLTANVAAYAVTSGGQRYKGPFEKIMQMDPSAGGLINDPQDALQSAVDLHDFMTERVEELEGKNIMNTPKALMDNFVMEKELAMRILKTLPTRDQMVEMQGLLRKYPQAMPSGGGFLGTIMDFADQSAKRLGEQYGAGRNQPAPQPQAPQPGNTEAGRVKISTPEEYEALAPGTKFVDQNGRTGTKGQGSRR